MISSPGPHVPRFLCVAAAFLICQAVTAQENRPIRDTTASLAASQPDSLRKREPIGSFSLPRLTRAFEPRDSMHAITREDLNWTDARYLGGLLENRPGAFLMDQSSEGQYTMLSVQGVDWRSVAFFKDGHPLNDPASGITNLYQASPDDAERIEFITGPRAFLYGLNSTGSAVNIVTKEFSNNTPATRIIYSEGSYGYGLVGGCYSQNITRRFNLMVGFQHQTTDGRYPNSAYDGWSLRSKLRYHLTDRLHLLLSDYYTFSETGLNGGITALGAGTQQAFQPLQAKLTNTDAYEKIHRHDLTLSLVGTLLSDTTDVSVLTLYYSGNFREYRDEENRTLPNGISIASDHASSWTGVKLTQEINARLARFSIGGSAELRQIEGSPNLGRRRNTIGSVWGKAETPAGSPIVVSGFLRHDRYLGSAYLGIGADASYRIFSSLAVKGGYSISRRVPTYFELYWSDSTIARIAPIIAERHQVVEVGVEFSTGSANLARLEFFHRVIQDPLLFIPTPSLDRVFRGATIRNGGQRTIDGVGISVSHQIWLILVEGTATYQTMRGVDEGTLSLLPEFVAHGGIYLHGSFLQENLGLKAGFRGRYVSAFRGERFNPEALVYVPSTTQDVGMASSVDFVLIARIGSAYVQFAWENLPGIQYFASPYFPAPDRGIRFGIAWDFLN